MMTIRKLLAGATMALLLMAAGPQAADAQVWSDYVCAEASYNPCVDFELFDNGGGNYSFVVTYVSVINSQSGYMTAAGLYDYDGGDNWNFTNVTLDNPTGGDWSAGGDDACEQLSGGGSVLFEGCVSNNDGINGGVPLGGSIEFNFDSGDAIALADFASEGGDLGARVHIQGVDEVDDCSYKLDSPQGFVSGCGGEIVPEPVTVLLLGTGLLGVGAVGYIRRRREDEEEV